MRRLSLLNLILAAALLPASATLQSSIGNEATSYTVQPVDMPVPEPASHVWDFSSLSSSGPEFSVSISAGGDSSISVTMPGVRHDFAVSGDTLWLVRSESHFSRLDFDSIPETMPDSRYTFSAGCRVFAVHRLTGSGSGRSICCGTGTLILPYGDTIPDVYLTETVRHLALYPDTAETESDSVVMSRRYVRYQWDSPRHSFPLAVRVSASDTVRGEPSVIHSTAFILTPEAVDDSRRPFSRAAGIRPLQGADTSAGHDDIITLEAVPVQGGVDITLDAPPGGRVDILLCDIQGRVLTTASLTPASYGAVTHRLPTGRLLPGQYVVTAVAGGVRQSVKILVM